MRVFVDRSSLEVTSDIGDALRARLDAADHLILLASIESASSRWCDEEVRHWLATKGPDTLLIVLSDAQGAIVWDSAGGGLDRERTTALPPSLIDALDDEPLWLDLSWSEEQGHVGLELRNPVFADAVATLASAITGTPKDELEGEDVRQHRTFRRIRAAAVSGLVVLTIAATVMTIVAVQNAREADSNFQEARSRELAVRTLATVDRSPETAVLTAVEAMFPGDVDQRAVAEGPGRTDQAEHALGVALRSFTGGADPFVDVIETPATAIAVTPDGRTIATGSPTSTVVLYDIASGDRQSAWDGPRPSDKPTFADLIRFNSDGTWIVAVGPPESVVPVWPPAGDLADVRTWDVFGRFVTRNAVPVSGRRSVNLSQDGRFTFAGTETGDLIWTDNESELLGGGFDETRLPNTISRPGQAPVVESVALAKGWLLLVGADGSLELMLPDSLPDAPAASSVPAIGLGEVVGVTAAADGSVVAVETVDAGARSMTIAQFADGTFEMVKEFEIERTAEWSELTSPTLSLADDRALAMLGAWPAGSGEVRDGLVTVVDVFSGGVVDQIDAPTGVTVQWLPGRSVLAIGSPSDVRFEVAVDLVGFDSEDVSTPVVVDQFDAECDGDGSGGVPPDVGVGAEEVTRVEFCGGHLVGFENGDLRRYDETGRRVERLRSPHESAVRSIAFDESGSLMVTASPLGDDADAFEFVVWETATWSVLDRRAVFGVDPWDRIVFGDTGRRIVGLAGDRQFAAWPNVDPSLACTVVSDEAITAFEQAEAARSGVETFTSACRRAGER